MENASPRYLPAGESALVVEFGQAIDQATHDRVMALDAALEQAQLAGVIETVPTYRSLMIHFDPHLTTTEDLTRALDGLETAAAARKKPTRWRIPACYDPPHGDDLAEVAAILGLAAERIIELHQGALYRVYMYGFAPGYTFLGGLPDELSIPRRATPRAPAPPGSLLIAGGQALIASVAMPTGWYEIGRTPVKVFDPRRARVFLADIGDEISFERIDPPTFDAMSRAADAGELVARPDPPEGVGRDG